MSLLEGTQRIVALRSRCPTAQLGLRLRAAISEERFEAAETSMTIVLSIVGTLLLASCAFSQSKPIAKEAPKNQTERKYLITQHTVVPFKGALPAKDLYIIEYGATVLKAKYAESQTSNAKPGDSPASNLHYHDAFRDPDVSQVPSVGVPIRACTFDKDRDTHGDLVIAHQSSDEPCMARIGDRLQFLPRPNQDFTYVAFDVLSEKMKPNR